MESYDKEIEWALAHGVDPDEHIRSLVHPNEKHELRTVQDAAKLVDYLTYTCYAFNRRRSPQTRPEAWEKIFGPTTARMELRFAVEEYLQETVQTGRVMHHLGRACDET
jgi:hypothetical protein